MKIGKSTRWVLAVGILVVLLAYLGVNYYRQRTEQAKLLTSMAQAQQEYIKYTTQYIEFEAQKGELERQLSEANSRIASLHGEFESHIKAIEINETLFDTASKAGVTITGLTTWFPVEEGITPPRGEQPIITCQVYHINITANGDFVRLINFVDRLSYTFSISNINLVDISVPAGVEESETEEKPVIVLTLTIYVYEAE